MGLVSTMLDGLAQLRVPESLNCSPLPSQDWEFSSMSCLTWPTLGGHTVHTQGPRKAEDDDTGLMDHGPADTRQVQRPVQGQDGQAAPEGSQRIGF